LHLKYFFYTNLIIYKIWWRIFTLKGNLKFQIKNFKALIFQLLTAGTKEKTLNIKSGDDINSINSYLMPHFNRFLMPFFIYETKKGIKKPTTTTKKQEQEKVSFNYLVVFT